MKYHKHRAISMFAAFVILVQLTGCNLLRSGANEYNDLVALVQGVQSAASNFQLVTDTQYAKIQARTQITKDYYDAVSNSGEVWTGNFRSEQELLNELLRNYRDENGQPLATSFKDYFLPTVMEMPELTLDHLVTPNPFTPGGFKGAGETGTVGPPAVLANAVEDALRPLGIKIRKVPLSPSYLWSSIEQVKVSVK